MRQGPWPKRLEQRQSGPEYGKVKSRNVTRASAVGRLALVPRRGDSALRGTGKGHGGADMRLRTMALTTDEEEAFSEELQRLRQEHRDLDTAIEALALLPVADRLQLQRLKKRKLILKDRISYLEDMLTPDIIA